MKEFQQFVFDPLACRTQLNELKTILDDHDQLSERQEILSFFRKRQQLSSYIGCCNSYMHKYDLLAYEYDLFGDFRVDLAIGDSQHKGYCFIEFEGASPTSIFKQKGGRATREWSRHFEHGYSQLIDWYWKLADMEGTREFASRFGDGSIQYDGMLIIGRIAGLEKKETDRLEWRRNKVLTNSRYIRCITFDELYSHLDARLRSYEVAFKAFLNL